MKERWIKMKKFPGFSISNKGRIRNDINGLFPKVFYNSDGYLYLYLRNKDGETERLFIHKEVVKAFNRVDLTGRHVHHKDHNRTNNCIDNLEAIDPIIHGYKTRIENGSMNIEKVRSLCEDLQEGFLTKHEIAAKYDITLKYLGSILRGERYKYITNQYKFHPNYRKKEDLTRERILTVEFIFSDKQKERPEKYANTFRVE